MGATDRGRWVIRILSAILLVGAVGAKALRSNDYCIIGAGPSGIQMGSFLQSVGRDYVIYERGNVAGNFFLKYPRHEKLISINKRYTGKTNDEFNMRHDWNSLLTDNTSLRMTKYSKDFFPHKSTLLKYLDDFSKHYTLNIRYNTTVSDVTPPQGPGGTFQFRDQFSSTYKCKVVIMATGYSVENTEKFGGSEHVITYSDISVNLEDYEGKSVLILGRGNSAFETADSILGVTNLVHIMGRSRMRLSWETHYVGDLRAVNNGILDTYQLKSLDGVVEAPVSAIVLAKQDNGKLFLNLTEDADGYFDNFALRDDYDIVISCLGFRYDFSIFNTSGVHPLPHRKLKKFPSINHDYESDTVPGIYFAGTSTHSLDFRKSAGGFIHGFRYTTRALFNLLEWKYQGIPWPAVPTPWINLMNSIFKRLNEASGTYQMFGVLGDVILIDDTEKTFRMLEEFPVKLIDDIYRYSGHNYTRLIVMMFEYGKDFSGPGKDIFRVSRATGEPTEAHRSNFLHPTFYYYKTLPTEAEMLDVKSPEVLPTPDRLHHIVEDFLTEFDAPLSHLIPTRRYIETCLGSDLRHMFAEECFEHALTHRSVPMSCQMGYLTNQGLSHI